MPIIAVAEGLGVGAAVAGYEANRKAGSQATQANKDALTFQKEMYAQSRADMAPWLESGKKALGYLNKSAYDTSLSPLARIQQSEGTNAINRTLAARGLYKSGAGIQSLSDFNRNLLASDSQSKLNQIYAMAGYGSQGLNAGIGANNMMSGQVGSNASNMGNIALWGAQNQNNLYSGLGNTGLAGANAYLYKQGLDKWNKWLYDNSNTPMATPAPIAGSMGYTPSQMIVS